MVHQVEASRGHASRWVPGDLGVGMVLVPGMEQLWADVADRVEVVEIEPQTFWEGRRDGGWQLHESAYAWLERLPQPVICHGVGYPVGGSVRPDPDGVNLTAASAVRLGARHWSEHLSFNRAQQGSEELESCFLLPPMQTWEAVDAAVLAVGDYQSRLELPFLVETPVNYLRPVPGHLDDGRFVAEVALRADCGILLDLHNLWANQQNGRQSLLDFVDQLPRERVLEVHLAGGVWLGDHYLDGHSGAVAPELLALAGEVLPTLPNLRAVIFEAMPDAVAHLGSGGICATLEDIHRIVHRPRRRAIPRHVTHAQAADVSGAAGVPRATGVPRAAGVVSAGGEHSLPAGGAGLAAQEHDLVAFTTRQTPGGVHAEPGAVLLRHLTDQARLSLVAQDRPAEVRQLCQEFGVAVAGEVAAAYLEQFPARLMLGDAGADFAGWWRAAAVAATGANPLPALNGTGPVDRPRTA